MAKNLNVGSITANHKDPYSFYMHKSNLHYNVSLCKKLISPIFLNFLTFTKLSFNKYFGGWMILS